MNKQIVIERYNPEWPEIFGREADQIKEVLGDQCIAIHHIGSTSVPGLSAKPIIDMICVVKDTENAIAPLQRLGFIYKGEYNIPLRRYFNRSEGTKIHLHVYQEDHPEIELNLLFRDYLREHTEVRDEYARLKKELLKEKSSYEKNNSIFTGYNLGKNSFIQRVLKETGFNRLRFVICTHFDEWDAAKGFRQKYFFDKVPIKDPYEWTFNHKDHIHFILYNGVEIIGYAHVQLWPGSRVAVRIIVVDENERNRGFGGQFLYWIETWLTTKGYQSIHAESSPNAVQFYRNQGYTEMPFNDPDGYEGDERDTPMGKILHAQLSGGS